MLAKLGKKWTMTEKKAQETEQAIAKLKSRPVTFKQAKPKPKPADLYLSPRAWLKAQFLCDEYEFEISAYGILSNDGKTVLDFYVPKQVGGVASTESDTDDVARWQEELRAKGVETWQTFVWFHTHPQGVLSPSGTDEANMISEFPLWGIMLILPKGSEMIARFDVTGKGANKNLAARAKLPIKVGIDWSGCAGYDSAQEEQWSKEVEEKVKVKDWTLALDPDHEAGKELVGFPTADDYADFEEEQKRQWEEEEEKEEEYGKDYSDARRIKDWSGYYGY